jgi:small redox-active disulfide protein 2
MGSEPMKIEVFGIGCARCKILEENVRKAVEESGIQAEIVKVQDIETMIRRGVKFPPALFIDGKEVAAGRVPNVKELKKILAR